MQGYIRTRTCSACVSAVEDIGCAQGGATKLKEYMRSLNILPQKRKRKASDGIPRSPRSPRSPDGLLPGDTDLPVTSNYTKMLSHALENYEADKVMILNELSVSAWPPDHFWALDFARAKTLHLQAGQAGFTSE